MRNCALILLVLSGIAMAQWTGRHVKELKVPELPSTPIQGSVKLIATVKVDGAVASIRVVGGHPVLVELAKDAIKEWKFSPGPAETQEQIQVTWKGDSVHWTTWVK